MDLGQTATGHARASRRIGTPAKASKQIVRVAGRRISVSRSGTGSPLLLLNGMGRSPATWTPLQEHLEGFECIRVGMPGYPDTVGRPPVLTMQGFAALVIGVLDELGIGRADVLGYSFGGMVAQQLALDAPARVRRLILVSTACGLGSTPSSPAAWWSAMFYDAPSFNCGPLWFTRQWHLMMRREFGPDWAKRLWPNEFAQQFVAASSWTSLGRLGRLPHQTLVVTGTADALVPPENATVLASRIPRARLHRVPGGGHLCVLDRAAEVGPVIAGFLRASES